MNLEPPLWILQGILFLLKFEGANPYPMTESQWENELKKIKREVKPSHCMKSYTWSKGSVHIVGETFNAHRITQYLSSMNLTSKYDLPPNWNMAIVELIRDI